MLLVLAVITIAVARLESAAPGVDRSTLWIDTVRRGSMVRDVQAPGTLVPERVRLVSALTAGRVEELRVRAGAVVTPETVLLVLSNPDVQLQALEAERVLAAAEAERVTARSALEGQRLAQEAVLAGVITEQAAALRADTLQRTLGRAGLTAAMEVQAAADKVRELGVRRQVEAARLALLTRAAREQDALQRAQVERLRGIAVFQRARVASMTVRAGQAGILQELPLELGQWVLPGQRLARVAEPGRLTAVLRVAETQVPDVVRGQPVAVDTRSGIIPGRVQRVDPAVQNGTVAVEVSLSGSLPRGARADLSVDGTITVERLRDVLFIARPAAAQPQGSMSLFVLAPNGQIATRRTVQFGRASVTAIEVRQGLRVGERVIVSDLPGWEAQDRLRLR